MIQSLVTIPLAIVLAQATPPSNEADQLGSPDSAVSQPASADDATPQPAPQPIEMRSPAAKPGSLTETKLPIDHPMAGSSLGPKWYERVAFDGTLDTYFTFRPTGDFRQNLPFRLFDTQSGTFQVNHARLGVELAPSPVGFRLDLGFGPIADIQTASDGAGAEVFKHFQQAFIRFAIPIGAGWTLDAGRFYSAVGTDMIDSKDNWTYSRGLIYRFGPLSHTGLRLAVPLDEHFTAMLSIVNGWDRVLDNNGGKTFGLTLKYSAPELQASFNYLFGPEQNGNNDRYRHLVDVVLAAALSQQLRVAFNGIFGHEDSLGSWYGIALLARLAVTQDLRLGLRGELFGDTKGARTGVPDGTKVGDFTATLGIPITGNVEVRGEFRQDIAADNVFKNGTSKFQTTFTAAAIAWF